MSEASGSRDAPTASELRHRMANTLQLLSALARMRSQRAHEAETKRQLVWLAETIASVGALEPKRQAARVDFAAYLRDMAPVWRRRYGAEAVDLEVEAAPLLVADSDAASLALIAQELVANALAHGFPNGRTGRVSLSLAPAEGDWALIVADDGQGFDPESRQGEARFGLWLARTLAAQMRGRLEVTSASGVTAVLRFKT